MAQEASKKSAEKVSLTDTEMAKVSGGVDILPDPINSGANPFQDKKRIDVHDYDEDVKEKI